MECCQVELMMGYQMEGKMECQINVTRLAIAHQKRTIAVPSWIELARLLPYLLERL